jgi:hypothetical protein
MALGDLLEVLNSERFELRPKGFFNVEGGRFTLTNDYFEPCDCYLETLGQSTCEECGKGAGLNSVTFPSGDGDGIFVAFEIVMLAPEPGKRDLSVGLIALFDYKFQIATHARRAIAAQTVPDFPLDLANQFEDCLALGIGSVHAENTLLIGNVSFSTNPKDAVVDFGEMVPGDYRCIAYCEQVDTTIDGIADRLSTTQGMRREDLIRLATIASDTFQEMAKHEPAIVPGSISFPPFVPRAIVAIHQEVASLLEQDEISNLNWELLKAQFRFGSIDMAHNRSVVQSVIWENVLLGFEYDRAAGECNDEEALRLQYNWRSWLYQGRELGNEDCINYLAKLKYEPSDEEEVFMYMRRGMTEAAARYL